jgi:DNA-binding IclR family transcriptional regulator
VKLSEAGPNGATLASLAEGCGVNKSTAYRALNTLRLRGFVIQSGLDAHYRLGPTIFEIGTTLSDSQAIAQALHPVLVTLSRESAELVHLGILVGDVVRYIDKVEPERPIRVWSAVGQYVSVASSAMGRALLAARDVPDQHLGAYLKSLPPESPVTAGHLERCVHHARSTGYAIEEAENEPDIGCIGVAIQTSDQPTTALSITVPMNRFSRSRQSELAALIQTEVPPLLPEGFSLVNVNS